MGWDSSTRIEPDCKSCPWVGDDETLSGFGADAARLRSDVRAVRWRGSRRLRKTSIVTATTSPAITTTRNVWYFCMQRFSRKEYGPERHVLGARPARLTTTRTASRRSASRIHGTETGRR